jgi:hypothetical protein
MRRSRSVPLVLFAALTACDRPARELMAPDRAPSAVSPAAVTAKMGSVAGAKAGGHADIHGTPVQNVRDQTYSFTAVSDGAPPLAKGQFESHTLRFTGEEISVHADVTCLSIVGNQAWVGARVRRWVTNGQEQPAFAGIPMIFRVVDIGEGGGTTDLASLTFFPPAPGTALAHCSGRPAFPILRESTNGNIQVRP